MGDTKEKNYRGPEVEENITVEILYSLINTEHLFNHIVSPVMFRVDEDFIPLTIALSERYIQHYRKVLSESDDPIYTINTMRAFLENHFNNSQIALCNLMVLVGYLHSHLEEHYRSSGIDFKTLH